MYIEGKRPGERFTPLEQVCLQDAATGVIIVKDALGRVYYRRPAQEALTFLIGGALGHQSITRENEQGHVYEQLHILVEAQTEIDDQNGPFSQLAQMLLYTMLTQNDPNWSETTSIRYNQRIYHFFVRWLRDHVHVLKGMKYFSDKVTSGIDLYRDSQREDGMIWDNVYPRTGPANYWDVRFAEGEFIRPFPDGSAEFKRIPVEADVEYLFVEGLYFTWKACGDDGWMSDTLDAAKRALDYSVSNPYRWSETYQLIKRGYTIDTWDFQSVDDSVVANDAMRVDPAKTHFGIMFGDNTGYIAACRYLATMLEHVGRANEAEVYRVRAERMQQRLLEVAWNGHYFTHHVPEHPERARNLGVDEASQISLSNAYSLNRGLPHEQSVAIIQIYQELREQLPPGSPGEWYTIYPPFLHGFGDHNSIWQYMNGSVTPIVAGELAHGAFEHGFEAYGVDILERLYRIGQDNGGLFSSSYTGAFMPPPSRQFTPLDITAFANADPSGDPEIERSNVPAWIGEGENDLHELPSGQQILADIPFTIPDPAHNKRRGCLILSTKEPYACQVSVPIGRAAGSLYLLHTVSQCGPGGIGGTITLQYINGRRFERYIVLDQNVSGWWFPSLPETHTGKRCATVAWEGKNAICPHIGVVAFGLDHPYPEVPIEHVTFSAAAEGGYWAIFGLTLCDQPVYFPPSFVSHGIPNSWGAAAVVYALIEGLVGTVDDTTGFERVQLSPRWTATDRPQVRATVRYPASYGYISYHFTHHVQQKSINLLVTGGGTRCECRVLLPACASEIVALCLENRDHPYRLVQVEQSCYAYFELDLPGPHTIDIQYQ